MKTLDEVIFEAPYSPTDWAKDALHYLKEYRKDKQIYAYDIARRSLELAERNDPLTWDELRTMEGKPVWVEIWEATDSDFVQYRWGNGAWYIVKDFVSGALAEYCQLTPNRRTWIKQSYGEEWQAYRKEREK